MLPAAEIEKAFDLDEQFRNVDAIFERVFQVPRWSRTATVTATRFGSARPELECDESRVFVTLKPSVFDPQGQTIADALHSMGYTGVGDVRQGKYFELELAPARRSRPGALAAEVADKLLANPVIESYRIEVD